MYFITIKRMLEVCFSAHPNIQYRTLFCAGTIQPTQDRDGRKKTRPGMNIHPGTRLLSI